MTWQPDYKIYLNRRLLFLDPNGDIFYDGKTWSATYSDLSITESNSDIDGNGITGFYDSYFPPIPSGSTAYGDNYSCPTTIPVESFRISATNLSGLTMSVGLTSSILDSIYVDWGDGLTSSQFTTSSVISHTYSIPFSGYITLKSFDLSSITTIQNDYYSGSSASINGSDFIYLDALKTINLANFELISTTSQLPSTLQSLYTLYNTLSGNVSNLPIGLTGLCLVYGDNTLSGDIAGLPSGISSLSIIGQNTLSGDVSGLPPNLTNLFLIGSNTISGDINDAPKSITYFAIAGSSTIGGDISNLPPNIQTLDVRANNTLTGDIAGLTSSITSFTVQGNNTISGDLVDISGLPLTTLCIYGYNTITGDISNAPSTITNFQIVGSNSVYGDIYDLPPNADLISIGGLNTINTYTSGRVWASTMNSININGSSGFNSTDIDNMLIDLSVPTWVFNKSILFEGTSLPKRTASSDAAVFGLTSSGVSVSII